MPDPEETKKGRNSDAIQPRHASDVVQRGESNISQYKGKTLLLTDFEVKRNSRTDFAISKMKCKESVDSAEEFEISTTSGVIADQLDEIEGELPLFITIKKTAGAKGFYTIY